MARSLSSRDIVRRLEAGGWTLVRTKGDHHQYKHPTLPGRVTVTHPVKDMPIGTLRSIFLQAGWRWPPE